MRYCRLTSQDCYLHIPKGPRGGKNSHRDNERQNTEFVDWRDSANSGERREREDEASEDLNG